MSHSHAHATFMAHSNADGGILVSYKSIPMVSMTTSSDDIIPKTDVINMRPHAIALLLVEMVDGSRAPSPPTAETPCGRQSINGISREFGRFKVKCGDVNLGAVCL